jgi:hypothetical protein
MISGMKGYLKVCMGVLAFCMMILVSGCSEDSAWGAGYQGVPLQQDGRPSVPVGTPPPGSGAQEWAPQGSY